jgi:hypothetical protein
MAEDALEDALAVFPNGARKAEKIRQWRIHLMTLPQPSHEELQNLDREEGRFLLDVYLTDIGGEG